VVVDGFAFSLCPCVRTAVRSPRTMGVSAVRPRHERNHCTAFLALLGGFDRKTTRP
jgi:hypothetical protein